MQLTHIEFWLAPILVDSANQLHQNETLHVCLCAPKPLQDVTVLVPWAFEGHM